MSDTAARWYCVNREGMATLCADEADARENVADNDKIWPRHAPHRAVQLVDAAELATLRAEVQALRAFRDFFPDRCEALFATFGMEPVALFNATQGAAIDAARTPPAG